MATALPADRAARVRAAAGLHFEESEFEAFRGLAFAGLIDRGSGGTRRGARRGRAPPRAGQARAPEKARRPLSRRLRSNPPSRTSRSARSTRRPLRGEADAPSSRRMRTTLTRSRGEARGLLLVEKFWAFCLGLFLPGFPVTTRLSGGRLRPALARSERGRRSKTEIVTPNGAIRMRAARRGSPDDGRGGFPCSRSAAVSSTGS